MTKLKLTPPSIEAQHIPDSGETVFRRPPSPSAPGVNYIKTYGGEQELPGLAVDVALALYEKKAERTPADEAVMLALMDAQDARDGKQPKKGKQQDDGKKDQGEQAPDNPPPVPNSNPTNARN